MIYINTLFFMHPPLSRSRAMQGWCICNCQHFCSFTVFRWPTSGTTEGAIENLFFLFKKMALKEQWLIFQRTSCSSKGQLLDLWIHEQLVVPSNCSLKEPQTVNESKEVWIVLGSHGSYTQVLPASVKRFSCLVNLPQMGRASLKSFGTKHILVQKQSGTAWIDEEVNIYTF